MARSRRYGISILMLLLFSVYTFTSAGKFHIVDEVSLFAVTESLALRGAVDTNAIAWTQWVNSPGEVLGAFGPEGDVYSKKGPLPAFLAVPWYLLLYFFARLDMSLGLLQGTLLWNGVLTALTAGLLWLTANRLGYGNRVAALLGLLFGLCTIAWPYANQFFGEPLSALSLLACFYGLISFLRSGRLRWMWLAGIGAGAAVATVTAHVLLVAVFFAYWLILWLRAAFAAAPTGDDTDAPGGVQWRTFLLAVGAFAAPVLVAGLLLLTYNAARFGSPFDTGYHFDSGEGFTTPIWQGFWGLIFSPYRGVFWHTPLFLASIFTIPAFWRRHRGETLVIAAASAVLIALYSMWWMWWGGFAWGPRFLVPMTPFWVLPLAIFAEQLDRWLTLGWHRNRRSRLFALRRLSAGVWVLVGAALLSFVVQLLAVSLNFVNYEIQLRERYPTNWEDPLEFGPPAQALTDIFDSPVVGQLRLLAQGLAVNSDLGWLWPDGNVQWLVVLVAGAVIATFAFLFGAWWMAAKPGREEEAVASLPMRILAPILLVLLLATWLAELTHTPHYGAPHQGYRAVIDEICSQIGDNEAVITIAPFSYQIPMNWLPAECGEPPPILGYATSSMVNPEAQSALARTLAENDLVWFVTAGLPPNDPDNTVERWLADEAFKSSDIWYDDFRLLRYATEGALADADDTSLSIPLGHEGATAVVILSARVPAVVESGQVAPMEIHYSLVTPSGADLRWFVQLLAPNGQAVALLDTGPLDGYVSFSQLPAGQELTDKVALQLPPSMPPGMYQLIAGLYDPGQNGAPRLRTPDGSDFVQLGIVEVVN